MPVIEQVAVLGAGTMGSRIAALFAAASVPVLLLDLTEAIAGSGVSRAGAGPLVTTASFDEGLPLLGRYNWVLEAVPEDLSIKRAIWQRALPMLNHNAIASTNTSGLSLAAIAQGFPLNFTQRFVGVHFFNPPAKLRLVELIRNPYTLPETAALAATFVTERLGKIVVKAKDTPNFIANRIGAFFSATAQALAIADSYTVEEVDLLTGPLIGLPRSGTFRLMDVIGLDIWAQVMRTLEPTDACFHLPPYFAQMLNRGMLGEKTGHGFYRKRATGGTVAGDTLIDALNLDTLEYRPATKPTLVHPTILSMPDLPSRLRTLLAPSSRASQFLQPLLTSLFRYCHQVAPEIAHSPADLDLAMQHGYGWELGPFALQAALA